MEHFTCYLIRGAWVRARISAFLAKFSLRALSRIALGFVLCYCLHSRLYQKQKRIMNRAIVFLLVPREGVYIDILQVLTVKAGEVVTEGEQC